MKATVEGRLKAEVVESVLTKRVIEGVLKGLTR